MQLVISSRTSKTTKQSGFHIQQSLRLAIWVRQIKELISTSGPINDMQDRSEDTMWNGPFFCALTLFYRAHEELQTLQVISTFLCFLHKHLWNAPKNSCNMPEGGKESRSQHETNTIYCSLKKINKTQITLIPTSDSLTISQLLRKKTQSI